MNHIIVKRLIHHLIGMLIMTFGIALTSKGNIGVASVSTISFAGSKLTPISFGMCSSLFQAFCFLAQIAVTRRFTAKSLLQIPMVYAFGWCIDLFNGLLHITPDNIIVSCLLVAVGTVIFSFGLRIILGADIALNPPDGLARAIGDRVGWPMSKSKFIFDITIVTSSAVLTLVFLGDAFVAVGFGTVITMLTTGPAVGMFTRLLPFFDLSDG